MINITELNQLLKLKLSNSDERYINIITGRKIQKTDKKKSIYLFDDKLQICCVKKFEKEWKSCISKLSAQKKKKKQASCFYDWASDQESNQNPKEYFEYIIDTLDY